MSADERRADDRGRLQPPPAGLEDLLRDMRALRLTLAADLTAAAGAAEAGAEDVVADILAGEQREVAGFARRSRRRLAALDGVTTEVPVEAAAAAATPRWRRRALVALPAVPMVGALAMSAAAAAGLLPLPSAHRHAPAVVAEAPDATAPVASTFHQFETVVTSDPSASQVVAAATALHHQLEQLIATAPHDSAGTTEIAKLLQMEQALLIRTRPPGAATVLAASRKLALRLVDVVASSQPSSGPTPADVRTSPHSTRKSSPKPTATASPTAATSPSSAPTTAPTNAPSPAATSSPSPSSSSDTGHLPTLGN